MTMLPQHFISQMRDILSSDESDALFHALESPASVAIRLNASKATDYKRSGLTPVAWNPLGYYVDDRPQFTFDPLFHAGCYYPQDASSMIIAPIAQMIADGKSVRYLDLCAAPGGKTTAVLDILPEGSLMVANEIMPQRSLALADNIVKWGNSNCIVTSADSARFAEMGEFFDIVAVDAPCSGEGMFRKDPEALQQWTPALVEECSERQRMILENAWRALLPGGYLIYSTCTYNRRENEEMIDYLATCLGGKSVEIPFMKDFGIREGVDTSHHCYRFMPHITRGEGLFIGVVRKPGEAKPCELAGKTRREKLPKIPDFALKELKNLLADNSKVLLTTDGETIIGTPEVHAAEIAFIAKHVKTLITGVALGSVKGKDFVPAHHLLMSDLINRNNISAIDIDYPTALSYLRGESICLNTTKRGIMAVSYQGAILGWVKNLGNRANNLYPRQYRIKSTYLPEKAPSIISL